MELSSLVRNQSPPIAIGGVGGSGTRLIATFLEELNFYIGSDLNQAKDNLWFTLLFKHIDILNYNDKQMSLTLNIFLQAMLSNKELSTEQKSFVNSLIHNERHLPKEFFYTRATSLFSNHNNHTVKTQWGWKEPNTHIVLDRLYKRLPTMKYIHVMRNGLDMAHSTNQNQQFLWGKIFHGNEFKQTPYYSLKYWCSAHHRLLETSNKMGNNFLLLNFDKFCLHPDKEVPKLLQFLEVSTDKLDLNKLKSLINAPSSIGRYKQYGLELFDKEDVNYVQALGFSIQ